MVVDTQNETEEWYRQYYAKHGADRNSPLNPEVVLQANAFHLSLISALRYVDAVNKKAKILDVGCGGGHSLLTPLQVGIMPCDLTGIDIQPDRVIEASLKLPGATILCGDASKLPFPDDQFDVAMASTMFVQLTDEVLAKGIAREMIRVVKPGGSLIILDWRYNKPGDSTYLAVNPKRIHSLFEADDLAKVVKVFPGALVPPVGRRLSKMNWRGCYFTLQKWMPFLVGQRTTILQVTKKG